MMVATAVAADEKKVSDLAIFDAHIHYSHDVWQAIPPADAIRRLREAGVERALVSSSSDEGTQRLYQADPAFVVPSLRPYRKRGTIDSWIAWTLSEGALHVSDQTNASATTNGLRVVDGSAWAHDRCAAFGGLASAKVTNEVVAEFKRAQKEALGLFIQGEDFVRKAIAASGDPKRAELLMEQVGGEDPLPLEFIARRQPRRVAGRL